MDVLKIVENIQRICKEKGTTPTVAGKESGAGKDLVSAMKRRGVLPSIEKMRLLAEYLGVTTSELLGLTQELTPSSRLTKVLYHIFCPCQGACSPWGGGNRAVPPCGRLTLMLDSDGVSYGGSTHHGDELLIPSGHGTVSLSLPPYTARLYRLESR